MTGELGPLLARLDRPRAATRTEIAVIADPHVADGTGTWKVTHRSRTMFERALDVAQNHDAGILVGDLTNDGRRAAYDLVDDALCAVDLPLLVVPGNHDVPKSFDAHEGLPVRAFEERYGTLPGTLEVGPLTLVGLDTASAPDDSLRETWGGRLGARDRDWLAGRLPELDVPVVVMHHNVATLPENPGGKWSNFQLRDAAAVRDMLVEHAVPLVVTGHHHVPAVATHGPTTELLSPATCSYPHAMLSLAVGPDGTTVRLVPLADRAETRDARRLAVTGKPLGAGITASVERRIGRLPLLDHSSPGEPGPNRS